MVSIKERLLDPNERFAPAEMFSAFEAIAEEYGFHRSKELPPKELDIETISIAIKGYEKFGVVVVRPRTNRDSMITIPSLVDRILGDDFTPSQNTVFNANLIALARTMIVSPPGLCDRVLNSTDDEDLRFFISFAEEYAAWMGARAEEVRKKKSGNPSTIASPSTSVTGETSSPPLPIG